MAFESLVRLYNMSNGALTDGMNLDCLGTQLTVASPSSSPTITNGSGVRANADNTSSTFYIVFPEDIDCGSTNWRIWIKFKYVNQVAAYYNRVRLIGRKGVPGQSDDSEITSVSFSGSTFELSGDGTSHAYIQAGCVGDFYRNFYIEDATSKFIYGYAGGLATGKQLVGGIHELHGVRLYSNTGTDSATDYLRHDTMKEYAYDAVYPARTEPRFRRMRALYFDLKNNDDYFIHSIYICNGSIFPTAAEYDGPAIINVSSAIIGDNGAEYEGYIRFPSTTPKGIVFYEHPNNNTQWQNFHDDETKGLACVALLANGYIVCSQRGSENSSASHYKASNWGGPDGRTYRDAFITYMESAYPSLPIFCLGSSMGFTNALVPLLRQTKNFKAVVGISPVTNITYARDSEGFASVVNAGWENNWATDKTANDPHLNLMPTRTGWMQRTPMLMIADKDETTIHPPQHSQALDTNLNAYGGSSVFTDVDAAGHLGNGVYDATSIPAFFNKFVTGGSGDFTMLPSADGYTCKRNGKVNVPVTLNRVNHSAEVTFSLISAPAGMSILEGGTGVTGSSPTIVIKCTTAVTEGVKNITLRATDGTNTRNYPLAITVSGLVSTLNSIYSRSRRDRRQRLDRI